MSSLDWKINDNNVVKINKKYVRKIFSGLNLTEDRYAFHKEHGINVLTPFWGGYKLYFN